MWRCLLLGILFGCGSAELSNSALSDDASVDATAALDVARLPRRDAAAELGVRDAEPDLQMLADASPPDAAVDAASVFDAAPRPDVAPVIDAAPPPDAMVGPPPLALGEVHWLHTDVSGWAETVTLRSVTFDSGRICLDHDHADAWPPGDISGVVVAANPWVFIHHEGRWWGATWEWMRPGQTCKNVSSVAGDHIKRAPFDEASGWRPRSGQVLYFMISGLARDAMRNAEERSNPVRVVWP